MKKKYIIGSIVGFVVVAIIAFSIYFLREFFAVMDVFMGMDNASKKELVENYETRQGQINNLKQFFNKIVPDNYVVYIEIRDKNDIDLWVHEYTENDKKKLTCYFQEWNINPSRYTEEPYSSYDSLYGPKTKSLELTMEKLNWNHDTFIQIDKYLESANCISVENGNPFEIGFSRSGMGKYSYYLFEEPIAEYDIEKWNDSCNYIYYKPMVVLGYGGGAIGPQCFPDP